MCVTSSFGRKGTGEEIGSKDDGSDDNDDEDEEEEEEEVATGTAWFEGAIDTIFLGSNVYGETWLS